MRIYLPIIAAVLAICVWLVPASVPSQNGAIMQPPLAPGVLDKIYSSAAAPGADSDCDCLHPQPTTAPTPAAAPSTAPAVAEIPPSE